MKEKTLKQFLDFWNKQDLSSCAKYITDNVELHSSYALKLFPESNGILKGKEMVLEYIQLIFKGFVDIVVSDPSITKVDDYFVVKANNETNTLSYYLHYYINEDDLIYLVKSNMTQPLR